MQQTISQRQQKGLILIRAREVAANLSLPVSLLDSEGNLVFFNEAAEAMHGVAFEEVGELSAAEWPALFAPLHSRTCRSASRSSSVGPCTPSSTSRASTTSIAVSP
jgi:PAS domain-containing protein